MPLSKVLQEIDHLDKSSPQFPDLLTNILSGEGYEGDTWWIGEKDQTWLIEYLDNVGVCIALCPLSAEPAQVLDTLDPTNAAYLVCLRELGKICFRWERLPSSYILEVSNLASVAMPGVDGRASEGDFSGLLNGSMVYLRAVHEWVLGEVFCTLLSFSIRAVDRTSSFLTISSSKDVWRIKTSRPSLA